MMSVSNLEKQSSNQVPKIYLAHGSETEGGPLPPCQIACPVETNVRGYLGSIAQGRYDEAFELIRQNNPIPGSIAMICNHPCEEVCRRGRVDDPLAIRHLKRFAVEQAAEYRSRMRRPVRKTKREKIAVIGSGPSGLTAANDLAEYGYKVTIFERDSELGGMLASAIPTYRLPREVLREDVRDILAKGIEARTNVEIGRELVLEKLLDDYDAVLLAVGNSQSRSLDLPGIQGEGVFLALPFLKAVAEDRSPALGQKVVVVGGGNVAIDVARTARRMGPQVDMVCLENREEMPAWSWEIEEAEDEGIKISHRWAPHAIRRGDGRLEGLEAVKVESVFDSSGRFNPQLLEEDTAFFSADSVMIAIGQKSDLSFLDGGVEVDEQGKLVWNPETQMTSVPGVFASGEVAHGPGSAIEAVASGHRAAKGIHLYLKGEDVASGLVEKQKEEVQELPEEVSEKIDKQPREAIGLRAPEQRCSDFQMIEIGYDETAALTEARRCLNCGAGAVVDPQRCSACLTCQRICPYDAPVVSNRAVMLTERCQGCGLCAGECPAGSIRMRGYDESEVRDDMPDIIGDVDPDREEPVLVAFQCSYYADPRPIAHPENIHQVPVPCVSRLDVLDFLSAFDCGADGAYVVSCREEDCRYDGVNMRIRNRVEQARQILESTGIGADRLGFYEAGPEPEPVWQDAAEDMTRKIKALGLRKQAKIH